LWPCADFGEFSLIGCGDGDAVEHGVDGDTGEGGAFVQRNTEFFVGFQKLGIDIIERFGAVANLGGGVIGGGLVVDGRDVVFCPVRRRHMLPAAECFETPVEQPGGFVLLGRNEADGIFVVARRGFIGFDIGHQAVFVVIHGVGDVGFEGLWGRCNGLV
jgi:hypothetical protein